MSASKRSENPLQPDQYYRDTMETTIPLSRSTGKVIGQNASASREVDILISENQLAQDRLNICDKSPRLSGLNSNQSETSIYSSSTQSESEGSEGSDCEKFSKIQRIRLLKSALQNLYQLSLEINLKRQNGGHNKNKDAFQHLLHDFYLVTEKQRQGIRKLGKTLHDLSSVSCSSSSSNYSSNEKAHLQQRLKSLSSELVSLRNHLHVNNNINEGQGGQGPNSPPQQGIILSSNPGSANILSSIPNGQYNSLRHNSNTRNSHPRSTSSVVGQNTATGGYTKPLPPRPVVNNYYKRNSSIEVITGQPSHHSSNLARSQQSNNFYVNQQLFPKDVARGDLGSENKQSGSTSGTRTASSGDLTPSVSSHSSSCKGPKSHGKVAPNVKLSATLPTITAQPKKVQLSAIEDLVHLPGPLTEDSLIRSLQSRCTAGKYFVYMGPILLLANPISCTGNALTLNSTKAIQAPLPIQKVVREALRQQADTGYPQAIVLSGCSGSGKTYTSMLILRQLFEATGSGLESDAFKHLTASVTVIRSLGTARTAANAESSRIGHFVEVQVTDGSLYRTKVHCYFLDQTRVVKTSADERNYHIFYQMLAGLLPDERSRLHLTKHSAKTLRYLNTSEQQSDEAEDARRFLDWKTCLCVLGIPFLDVLRVLSAVVLIGNVKFKDSPSSNKTLSTHPSSCLDLEVEEGEPELQSAAALLGVSEIALRQGLTIRTHNARGHLVRSRCDANLSNTTRDSLAKSLYCRTVATIVRRANSLKRLNSHSGTLSSDSADSVHNQAEVASQHASTVGTAGSKASKSMTALMAAVRHATDGFIGILDMFGFEDMKRSRLEQLCINLCAETMQHFYNTHIFKACIESCREEGIRCDEIEYHDNVPCIDLISSLRTGLLSMLDVECSVRGTVESYVQKVQIQHSSNPRFLETKATELRSFAIQHYTGKVYYDVTDFPETNRDVLADDLVAVFHKHRCSFGFASHLFSSELKVLGAGGTMDPCPKGISFRIQPTSNTEMLNGEEPVSTLTQDFHTRLDNLLRTLVHTKPHFIRCIKINESEQRDLFDRYTVSKQLRAFQVLETVNLMAYGYPHRMRFKAFNGRYKLLAPFYQLSRTDEHAVADCHRILETFDMSLDSLVRESLGHISMGWALGKRHVFLSEGARQQLENLRVSTRTRAATRIQTAYRGWYCRRRWPAVRQTIQTRSRQMAQSRDPIDPKVMVEVIGPTKKAIYEEPYDNVGFVPFGQSSHFTGNLAKSSNFESRMLHQAFPVPSQRTSSAAVISSCVQTCTGNNSHPNYKNLPAVIHGNSEGSGVNQTSTSTTDVMNGSRPRPQPIAGTPPPEGQTQVMRERPELKLVQQKCSLYGLDMERPPSLPPSRSYTIIGNRKLGFPQTRSMRRNFPDEVNSISSNEIRLLKGELVTIHGPSPRRGHLMVEYKNRTLHLPFQLLDLRVTALTH